MSQQEQLDVLIELVALIVASAVIFSAGAVVLDRFLQKYFKDYTSFLQGAFADLPYNERLKKLTDELTQTSKTVDSLLAEYTQEAKERENAITALEDSLNDLEVREETLKTRIQELENVPVPVAKHFAELLEPREKRDARRDLMFFLGGVFVTTVGTLVAIFLT